MLSKKQREDILYQLAHDRMIDMCLIQGCTPQEYADSAQLNDRQWIINTFAEKLISMTDTELLAYVVDHK